jgi:hypothetical protein
MGKDALLNFSLPLAMARLGIKEPCTHLSDSYEKIRTAMY